MRCVGWCGQCYANRTSRQNYAGHSGYRRPRGLGEADFMAFFKKPSGGPSGSQGAGEFLDNQFVDRYPILAEFLTLSSWEDGTVRETGTMFLFCQSGWWKLMLKDRDAGTISFWASATLEEMFAIIETALGEDRVDWKKDRKPPGRGR